MVNEDLKKHIKSLVDAGDFRSLYNGRMIAARMKIMLGKKHPGIALAEEVSDLWHHASNYVAVMFDVYDSEGNFKPEYALTDEDRKQIKLIGG